mmetsp:Transcript_41807/g.130962  ORF Transcript_41807/g.130962 Transcript_41807/m.130962 type:complete len:221 (-) Transcript_41807:2969-3631(-)
MGCRGSGACGYQLILGQRGRPRTWCSRGRRSSRAFRCPQMVPPSQRPTTTAPSIGQTTEARAGNPSRRWGRGHGETSMFRATGASSRRSSWAAISTPRIPRAPPSSAWTTPTLAGSRTGGALQSPATVRKSSQRPWMAITSGRFLSWMRPSRHRPWRRPRCRPLDPWAPAKAISRSRRPRHRRERRRAPRTRRPCSSTPPRRCRNSTGEASPPRATIAFA